MAVKHVIQEQTRSNEDEGGGDHNNRLELTLVSHYLPASTFYDGNILLEKQSLFVMKLNTP